MDGTFRLISQSNSLTCFIAVTVMTKNKGRPLVTGLVGVSTITYAKKKQNTCLINLCYTQRKKCIAEIQCCGAKHSKLCGFKGRARPLNVGCSPLLVKGISLKAEMF